MNSPKTKERNFCWQCGRNVAPEQEKCYFCSARLIRTIGDARHCPFCYGEIHEKAIKCPHCGEFLNKSTGQQNTESAVIEAETVDDRSGVQAQPNIVFLIPPPLSPDGRPKLIPAGEKLSEEALRNLSTQTRKAIESGQPETLDMPEIKALPPAEAKRMLELEAPDSRSKSATLKIDGATSGEVSYEVVPRSGDALPPSRKTAADTALALSMKTGALVAQGAWKTTRFLSLALVRGIGKALYAPRKTVEVKELAEEEPSEYKTCERCQTEVLRTDNYCYHCGAAFVKVPKKIKHPPRNLRSNFGHFFAMAMIYGVYFLIVKGFGRLMIDFEFLDLLLVLPPIIGVIALFRRFGIDSLFFLIVSIIASFYIFAG